MRRLFITLFTFFLVTVPLLAQSTPEILTFTYDGIPLVYDEVESGIATSDFSWEAINVRPPYRMQMHALVGGKWVLIGENFDAAKSDTLVIAHPLSFDFPTYRLSIINANGTIVDEQKLYLSYQSTDPDGAIEIVSFTASESSISRQSLISGNQVVPVAWEIGNRRVSTNLLFEQAMSDGTWQLIELPRFNDWVRSVGTGFVAPINNYDEDTIMIQLRVVDIISGETLGLSQLELTIINDTGNPEPSPIPSITPTTFPPITFNTPFLVTLGQEMRVTWDATSASNIADEVIIREWHSLYFGGKFGEQPGYIDSEGDIPVREWTGLSLADELTFEAPAEFPLNSRPYDALGNGLQNVVVFGLYLRQNGEEVDLSNHLLVEPKHAVYLRTQDDATNCTPSMQLPEQVISNEPVTISWDMCAIPFVNIEFSPNVTVSFAHSSVTPLYGSGSLTYWFVLGEGQDMQEVTVRIFSSILGDSVSDSITVVSPE